jgi:phosphohistidine phosphatase
MHLYLVQHGAATPETENPQRLLTNEGRRTVEGVAEHLSRMGVALGRIEHSDKPRARQTAEILAARLRPAKGVAQVAGLAPNDGVESTYKRLNEETESVMIVGHLPHLSRLASRLLGNDPERVLLKFQMGGVVKLERDADGGWTVSWMLMPDLLPHIQISA